VNNANSDFQLIDRIRKNDKGAFHTLYIRYYKILLSTSFTVLKDINEAKDVTQDVFFEIWKIRKSINIKSTVPAYLKKAVINRSINRIKYLNKMRDPVILNSFKSTNESPMDFTQFNELDNVVQKALEKLPERCRLVFTMKRVEGMRLKEIANELDISSKTVENQLTKALKILKDELLNYDKNIKQT
jgi:RNA polymerase sigma-70 factor (ECF subfamily)